MGKCGNSNKNKVPEKWEGMPQPLQQEPGQQGRVAEGLGYRDADHSHLRGREGCWKWARRKI